MVAVIHGVLEAENEAIRIYNELIRACEQKDYVTQELAIDILADEEEHRTLFDGFLRSFERHGLKAA